MTYDAVVLDMDGVIVERSPSWVFDDAAQTALAEVGIHDPTDREFGMVRSLRGELSEATDHFEHAYGVRFGQLWRRRNELITENQVRAMDDGEKALYDDANAIERLPGPRGIVSNNQQAAVENILRRFGLDSAFDTYHGLGPTLSDVGEEKPSTTYMERALSDLDVDHAVYVGDRASDVQAAHNVGIDAAFVRREFNADDDPDPEPRYDVDSLHELATEIERLDGSAR
ncbi:MAG: HAD family hydrolase [Halolamina sp.]